MRRIVVAIVAAVAAVGGCAPAPLPSAAPPTPAPRESTTAGPSGIAASPTAAPGSTASPQPSAPTVPTVPSSETAYVALDPVTIAIKDGVGTYTAPAMLPTFGPDAQPAAGFTLLPICPPDLNVSLVLAAPKLEAGWENLSTTGHFEFQAWPSVEQLPRCAAGKATGYLESSYYAAAASAAVVVSAIGTDVPATISVVPVYTPATSGIPWMAMAESVSNQGSTRPKDLSASKRRAVFESPIDAASFYTLPDGSHPNHFAFRLTGCSGGTAMHPKGSMTLFVSVGTSAPLEMGTCGGGSFSSSETDLAFPADGQVKVAISSKGGSTGFGLRISEFMWRSPDPGS
jgi:hypothetical protein